MILEMWEINEGNPTIAWRKFSGPRAGKGSVDIAH